MKRRQRFQQAGSYALYYGQGEEERLSRYQIAIVEPLGQTMETVRRLQAAGTLVVAYVSVVEVADYDESFHLLTNEDFILDKDDRPLRNEAFNTYMMDLRSVKWLGLLHHRIGSKLLRNGYDGVFLDTIGNVEMEYPRIPQRHEQIAAAAQFVRRLRELFPEHIIIQNNGLNELCMQTAPWIDGLCWENPDFVNPRSVAWANAVAERIGLLSETYGLRVLLLSERGEGIRQRMAQLTQQIALSRGFLWYEAAPQYLGI
jgi:hypothetical protein